MNTQSEKVAKILLGINAVILNPKKPFRYSSGILSPVYTDCRLLMSYPKERKQIRNLYVDAINSLGKVDVIAGTATAGIPHAAWVAEKMNLPMVFVRSKAKDHGRGNMIEGLIKKKQRGVIIEDLISTGQSSIHTAESIREVGGTVSHIVAIITYGMQRAKDNFRSSKLKLITLTDFPTVVSTAAKDGLIKDVDQKMILEWIKDPPSWGKTMGFE